MLSAQYPDSLVERLRDAWKPPHRRPLVGDPGGVAFSDVVLRDVVAQSFFASLRAEEGVYLQHGLVLVPNLDVLRGIFPSWSLMAFEGEVEFTAGSLAKLAPALTKHNYAVVAVEHDRVTIVGIGRPLDGNWVVGEDRYPRIRCLGPGDLVFLRGESALFRYRGGEVFTPQDDYFRASGEPAITIAEIASRLFEHRPGMIDEADRLAVRNGLAEMMDAVAIAGHGALLALLAPDDPEESSLRNACDYRIAPIDFGTALVNSYESGMVMAQIDQEMMGPGPDYAPYRAPTKDELGAEAAWNESKAEWQTWKEFVAGAASVDGAVLLTTNLRALGFGCKLPRGTGAPPAVKAPGPDGTWTSFDLTKRGTRHAAAAQFASKKGRLALIVSADGPAGCFYYSVEQSGIIYRPVSLGPFAQNRWYP